MITYAERVRFGVHHVQTLAHVAACVARVSNAWGNELRCHELARAVQLMVGEGKLAVIDGHCGPFEHSWLVFPDGVIIDSYVVGRLPSIQIIDPFVGAYRSGAARVDIRQEIVDRLVGEMRDGA